jgi:REP element-mobilizing transposase RayT
MWNDTDFPLAFLITFRCYGTWLHGDERGSINRFRNQYKTHRLPSDAKWIETNQQRLKGEIVTLNAEQRNAVEKAIREVCEIRVWNLQAINVRTNHVHTVVAIGTKKPEIALNGFKANATREMRQSNCWQNEKSPWADKGSKRYLWNEKSVAQAIDYVINGQGDDLPDFD